VLFKAGIEFKIVEEEGFSFIGSFKAANVFSDNPETEIDGFGAEEIAIDGPPDAGVTLSLFENGPIETEFDVAEIISFAVAVSMLFNDGTDFEVLVVERFSLIRAFEVADRSPFEFVLVENGIVFQSDGNTFGSSDPL
jgi:hypothetical protein